MHVQLAPQTVEALALVICGGSATNATPPIGLNATVQGIGALRSFAGDAHGRERGFKRIDARIAPLAIHSAGSAALLIIETWQRKFPTRSLIAH